MPEARGFGHETTRTIFRCRDREVHAPEAERKHQGVPIVLIVVCLAMLFGIVLGLRVNVRGLLVIILVEILASVVASGSGLLPIGAAMIGMVAIAIALQFGYGISILIGAMQLVDTPADDEPVRREVGQSRAAATTVVGRYRGHPDIR